MEMREVFSADAISALGLEYRNGVTKTLSNTGYMRNYLGPVDERFVREASSDPRPVIDIGCGLGAVIGSLARCGVRKIVGVDIEPRQLKIVRDLLDPFLLSTHDISIELICDALPALTILGNKRFGSILCAQVLQYLKPYEFMDALSRLRTLLVRGGRLYVTVMSQQGQKYVGFAEEYGRRRDAGDRFPGFMDDPSRYHKTGIQHNPGFFLCFDPMILKARVTEAGFTVLETSYVDDANDKAALTGLVAIND